MHTILLQFKMNRDILFSMENTKLKLIVQIPCLNEASTLPSTFKKLPQSIKGIDYIETLIVDDGSNDNTKEVAKELGINHIIVFPARKGLARAFITGLDASLKLGADIIVNLDADGQYDPEQIPELIQPIIEKKADMVVGVRDIDNLKHFSFIKKRLQRVGSWFVRKISGTSIPDVTSGFRAFSKEAALSLNVLSDFTYTIETLIQAGNQNIALQHVPIHANPVKRKSRLFKSIQEYISKSVSTIIRIYTMYKPLKVFSLIATFIFAVGILIFVRFLHFHFTGIGTKHIQYLIVSAVTILLSVQVFMIGLLADLISANRKLIENTLKRVKTLELSLRDKKDV